MDKLGWTYPTGVSSSSTPTETATKVTVKDPLMEILHLMDTVIFTPERRAAEEQFQVAQRAMMLIEEDIVQVLEHIRSLYGYIFSATSSHSNIPIVLRSKRGALLVDQYKSPYEVIVKDLE